MTLRAWLSLLGNVQSPWAKLPARFVDPTNPDGPSRAGFGAGAGGAATRNYSFNVFLGDLTSTPWRVPRSSRG